MTARGPTPSGGAALLALVALAAAALAAPGSAHARPSESGFFAEAGLGGTGFLGDAAPDARTGVAGALRGGYDLTDWLAAGVALAASTHEVTVPPPPTGEFLQLYTGAAELQLSRPSGAFVPYARAGAGAALVSTNLWEKVGRLDPEERASPLVTGGAGLTYQLQDRHYAFGAGAEWALLPGFGAMHALSARAFIRYTF